jgi:hypothetical protein
MRGLVEVLSQELGLALALALVEEIPVLRSGYHTPELMEEYLLVEKRVCVWVLDGRLEIECLQMGYLHPGDLPLRNRLRHRSPLAVILSDTPRNAR